MIGECLFYNLRSSLIAYIDGSLNLLRVIKVDRGRLRSTTVFRYLPYRTLLEAPD